MKEHISQENNFNSMKLKFQDSPTKFENSPIKLENEPENCSEVGSDVEIIDSIEEPEPAQSNSKPFDIEIIFRNDECAQKYKENIEAYLKQLLSNYETFTFKFLSGSHSLKRVNHSISNVLPPPSSSSPPSSVEKRPRPKHFYYSSPFLDPLDFGDKNDSKKETRKKASLMCFNCLGEHHLKDCPEDIDPYRIAKNKKDYFEASSAASLTNRYHGDDPGTSSGDSFKAGFASPQLREALNLMPDQLPPYIYTMRVLGYPPGWLEDAKVEVSGISVFDSDISDENNCNNNDANQFDATRFVEYPGFNLPVPPQTFDEYRDLGMPPLLQHQLLSSALRHNQVSTTVSNTYKKKKFIPDNEEISNSKKAKLEEGEEGGTDSEESNSCKGFNEDTESGENSKITTTEEESPSVSQLYGIPLLETPNSDKNLPNSAKFSSGVAEHENFENLPEATGAYDSMRDLIGSVRQKLFDKNE